jgi:4-hydroxybenzoate polyprenyltransferase
MAQRKTTSEAAQTRNKETLNNTDSLAHQYGGNSKAGWVGSLPDSWIPYIQLARLSPPAGLFLIYFPHLFGVLLSATHQRSPLSHVLKSVALALGGSFFVSNAIHIWNDLIDAPLDALVERTRNRPIPRGAVSTTGALVFTATQTIGALVFLFCLPERETLVGLLYALPAIGGWVYYPWAKRHTDFPQLVLGLCLAWGIVMGSLFIGVEPFTLGSFGSDGGNGGVDGSTLCLFLACVLWTMIYDTIYAHQDVEDDIKAGIKSLAVLYRDQTKGLLWQLLALMVGLLIACGWISGMGLGYYVVAVGGSVMSLGLMIQKVDLKSKESCWWWFGKGFWFAGGAIGGGLIVEYLSKGGV